MIMLDRYKEIIDKAKSAKLETLTAWYSLRMKEDPFTSLIPDEEIDFFVNREEVVESILYDIAVASRGIPIMILLVGCSGSGKSTTLKYIQNIFEKLGKESDEYYFEGLLVTADSLFETSEEVESLERLQPWLELSRKKLDYLLVDDAKIKHVGLIMREFVKTRLKLFALSPLEYEEVLSVLPVPPRINCLYPFSFGDTVSMLDKRIKRVLVDKNRKMSISTLFREDALRFIHECCMGVPGLILKCASMSLQILTNTNYGVPSGRVTLDVAKRACRITRCLQAYENFEKISSIKRELLQTILNTERSPTEISSLLEKDRSTISRHLSDLRELGLVEFRTRGRESVYKVTLPLKIRFELENMPSGGKRFASA